MNTETKQKSYSLIVIKVLIGVMFIGNLIAGVVKTNTYFFTNGSYDGISFYFNLLILKSFFIQMLFLIIPLIGIFLKNKFGWISISAYFYFLLINVLFYYEQLIDPNYLPILVILITGGIISYVISLLNKKKISFQVYKINPSLRLTYNIIPFTIGFGMSISLLIIRNWYNL